VWGCFSKIEWADVGLRGAAGSARRPRSHRAREETADQPLALRRPQAKRRRRGYRHEGAARARQSALFQKLVAGEWIERHQNLLIIGPTGVGKTGLRAPSATRPVGITARSSISACHDSSMCSPSHAATVITLGSSRPHERIVIAAPESCPCCGSTKLSKLGEDITETLEVIPRQWRRCGRSSPAGNASSTGWTNFCRGTGPPRWSVVKWQHER
jgi:hypothetical protein